MRIESGRIINDFIEPNKRQYAIPVYQRNYEWSKEQCTKLFGDIVNAYRSDKSHFCGSIVYSLLEEEKGTLKYIVIDGQQRLTTIYILLKALLDESDTDTEKECMEECLMNRDRFDDYKIDEASKLKLKPIKSDNQQIMLLIGNKIDMVDRTSGIWKNYDLFRTLIKEQKEENDISVKDIYRGLSKLTCAKISLDCEDNPQEIFERINSTGLPLSLADKVRNFVLMTDANQEELYENYWLSTEINVHRENMNRFILDFLNTKTEYSPREDDAYEEFKEIYKSNNYTNETILKEMKHYSEFYKVFLFGDSAYSERINTCLKDLRTLKQTTMYLFLFKLFDDYTKDPQVLKEEELEKILTFLVNYSIRRIVCEIGSNSLRGLYKSLYNRVFPNGKNKDHYYDAIVSFFMQLTSKDALVSDDTFREDLKTKNIYRKNALCKYLLVSIENRGKEKVVVDDLTIEHIMPQNKNLSTSWQKMLGDNWQEIHDNYMHTLGNLTLTGYNSELGDKPFDEKKGMFKSKSSKIVDLYSDVLDKNEWNKDIIEARANRLIDIIIDLFPIENPTNMIEFKDPRYKEYTCSDPKDATYKYINYYILQGEQVNCDSFAEMLKLVMEQLYAIDKTIIEEMAIKSKILSNNGSYALVSYNKDMVKGDYMLKDTNIYESSGYSAFEIVWYIKQMLIEYDIDESDFVYSARTHG